MDRQARTVAVNLESSDVEASDLRPRMSHTSGKVRTSSGALAAKQLCRQTCAIGRPVCRPSRRSLRMQWGARCAVGSELRSRQHWHRRFNQSSAVSLSLRERNCERGVHTSTKQLEADVRAFIRRHNEKPKPYRWTESADEILASVKRFCQKPSRRYATNFRRR